MNTEAYLLDDGILLRGVVKMMRHRRRLLPGRSLMPRKTFVPNDRGCGFDAQIIFKGDEGKILFYSMSEIIKAGLSNLEVV